MILCVFKERTIAAVWMRMNLKIRKLIGRLFVFKRAWGNELKQGFSTLALLTFWVR